MLKSELETAIGRSFSEDEYNLINTVYMYYPGIEDKKTVYTMLFRYGFTIFNDLYPRARQLADLEMNISKLRGQIEVLSNSSAIPIRQPEYL